MPSMISGIFSVLDAHVFSRGGSPPSERAWDSYFMTGRDLLAPSHEKESSCIVLWHTSPVKTPASVAPEGDTISRAIADFQAGRGREDAFRLLFEHYYRPLRRFFYRKSLTPEVCLDLAQETLLLVYRGLDGYRPEAPFESWLYTIARTTHLKWLRDRHRAKRSGEEVSIDAGEITEITARQQSPLSGVLDSERRETVRAAVADLPDQMRRCLVLQLFGERSYREIGTVLGISTETVKSHLREGRRRLAATLDPTLLESLSEAPT